MVLMQQYDYSEKHIDQRQVAYQTPLLSQDQYDCLNRLVGAAAFDETIFHRLLVERDETLRTLYRLSDITWNYLVNRNAKDLFELSGYLEVLHGKMLNH